MGAGEGIEGDLWMMGGQRGHRGGPIGDGGGGEGIEGVLWVMGGYRGGPMGDGGGLRGAYW